MSAGPAYRIVTPRLVIRLWDPADAPQLSSAIEESLAHLRPWMPWTREEPLSLEKRLERLRQFRARFDLGEDFVYGILDAAEARVVGGAGLHARVGPQALEIGYWIHVDLVGQGLATEAAGALTRVGFEVERLARMEIHCEPTNRRSARVPEKLGYLHEATLRQRIPTVDGSLRDTMVWSLFREDYPKSAAASREVTAFDALGRRIL